MNNDDFDIDMINELMAIVQELKAKNALNNKPLHSLYDILQKMKVHQLRELASLSFATGYSKLKKADLINLLLEVLINPEFLEAKLSFLPIKVMSFFLRVLKTYELIDNEVDLEYYLMSQELGLLHVFHYKGDMIFVVADEIKEHCLTLMEDGVFDEIEEAELLNEYARAAVNLYGIIPVEEIVEIYNSQNNEDIDEEQMSESLTLYGDEGLDFYFWQEYLVYPDFEDDDFEEVEYLASVIEGKPRYIPPKEEFLKYSDYMYLDENEQSKALEQFLRSQVGLDIINARELATDVAYMATGEMSLQEIIDIADSRHVVFNEQKEFERFVSLIIDLDNNSRIWSNKGHTPLEMMINNTPILRVIKGGKGIICRNELCPCGSGKKYKNCCGKDE